MKSYLLILLMVGIIAGVTFFIQSYAPSVTQQIVYSPSPVTCPVVECKSCTPLPSSPCPILPEEEEKQQQPCPDIVCSPCAETFDCYVCPPTVTFYSEVGQTGSSKTFLFLEKVVYPILQAGCNQSTTVIGFMPKSIKFKGVEQTDYNMFLSEKQTSSGLVSCFTKNVNLKSKLTSNNELATSYQRLNDNLFGFGSDFATHQGFLWFQKYSTTSVPYIPTT